MSAGKQGSEGILLGAVISSTAEKDIEGSLPLVSTQLIVSRTQSSRSNATS